MSIKNILKPKKIQGRDVAGRDLENVSDGILTPSSSVQDRVVSNPEGEEQEPKKPDAKPIASINGKDIDDERAA